MSGFSVKTKAILHDALHFASARYIVQTLGVINSIALRFFMGPHLMGVWSILQVVLGYCGYASFGTTKAMARDYPFLRGKKEHEKAEKLKDLVLTFSMLMSFIPSGIIGIYLIINWGTLPQELRFGLVFLMAFLFIQRFYDLIILLLRADKKFVVLSKLIVVNALGGLLITFALVSKWNIYGLCIGTALVTVGSLFYLFRINPYHFKYFWNIRNLWRELKLGIPLITVAFLVTILISLDKWLIVHKLGFSEVGLYSIMMMANSYVASLPMVFSNVWYPHLQHEYGRRENPQAIKNYLLKPAYGLAAIVPFLAGGLIFTFPVIVHLFLPKFIPGLDALKFYLMGTYFFLLSSYSKSYLVTLDKIMVQIPSALIAILVNAVLNLTFLSLGWGLSGVAMGTAVSFTVYGLISYITAVRQFSSPWETVKHLTQLLSMVFYFYAAIFIIDRFVNVGDFYLTTAARLGLFLLVSFPILFKLERDMQLLKNIMEIIRKKKEKRSGQTGEALDSEFAPGDQD